MRLRNFGWIVLVIGGYLIGYAISPAATVGAQRSSDPNAPGGQHQPPEFKSTIPAPQLRQPVPMWPNQPMPVTYWSIDDIRQAHATLSEAEKTGKRLDPNSTLHGFPYWTRTHSLFIYHTPEKAASATAHQHAGYSQFIVIMGGTGSMIAGGELQKKTLLTEAGRQIPGEYRGTGISGGETFQLKEGDWVSIPPDTPAQVKADAGGLTYMVMKVNAMLYPWELVR